MSAITDYTDRNTCVLFGDGAGAVVLEASDEPGILSTHLHADGAYEELLHVPGGIGNGLEDLAVEMRGNEVFRMAVNTLGRIVDETLEANDMQKSDVDWLVPHQANIRIIQATARKLRMNMDHVVVTVDEHGNTSAASIPIAFCEAIQAGKVSTKDKIVMVGFGAGLTWGATVVEWGVPMPYRRRQWWYRVWRWFVYRWARVRSTGARLSRKLENRLDRDKQPEILPEEKRRKGLSLLFATTACRCLFSCGCA